MVVLLLISFIIGTIYVGKGRKYPKLVLDNYVFRFHRRKYGKTRWLCPAASVSKCKATLYTYGTTVEFLYKHNHEPLKQHGYEGEDLIPRKFNIIRRNDK